MLQAQQVALRDSELRWQNLAQMLEQVAQRAPLPETLQVLVRTLQDQVGVRCAVLLRWPGRTPLLVAPGFGPAVAPALRSALLPPLAQVPAMPAPSWEAHLDASSGQEGDVLLGDGVQTLRAWALPCATDDDVAGVLALCYPDAPRVAEHDRLALGAARVAALAVDHVLVQDQLTHQAGHDTLTDLPNRTVFLDRLGQALRHTSRGTTSVLVLFLDLDRFKIVNDSLGHRAGDALLRSVADRLARAVRPGDTVARFGGDEFTVLCEGIDGERHALQVVHRVQEVLSVPFPLGDSELFATASIGIALGHGSQQAPDTLLDDADAAMYRAKERGGNCYELFDAAMRDRAVRRLATQSALHRGLEREEFRVVYQPIVRAPRRPGRGGRGPRALGPSRARRGACPSSSCRSPRRPG